MRARTGRIRIVLVKRTLPIAFVLAATSCRSVSFTLPEGFVERPPPEEVTRFDYRYEKLVYAVSKDGDASITIGVGTTLEKPVGEHFEGMIAALQENTPGVVVIGRGHYRLKAGAPAPYVDYQLLHPQHGERAGRLAIVPTESRRVVVGLNGTGDAVEKYSPAMSAVVDSIQPDGGPFPWGGYAKAVGFVGVMLLAARLAFGSWKRVFRPPEWIRRRV